MNPRRLARFALVCCLLLAAASAQAQNPLDLHASHISYDRVEVKWRAEHSDDTYSIEFGYAGQYPRPIASTTDTEYHFENLLPQTNYVIVVHSSYLGGNTIHVRTIAAPEAPRNGPTPVTCPNLPASVVVYGHELGTQCQMVGEMEVARPDFSALGILAAVDIWSYIPTSLEVCFKQSGYLAFLDAAYAPRLASALDHVQRNGMTCGHIDSAGTVVLLAAPTPDHSPAQPPANTLPVYDAIPTSHCQIKLIETLYLRNAPAGKIVGLVWLYSEVPVFEVSGDWYKIEFEGTIGYISRYYRRVLRGGCG